MHPSDLPPVRGKYLFNEALAPFTWFRVGGPAEMLFLPADPADLQSFLQGLPSRIPVTVLGVGSNVIVRDGGIGGVVVRLMGRPFGAIRRLSRGLIEVGAGRLDAQAADFAAEAGIAGLEFLTGIPGTIGGAVRMNAGCYGGEIKDALVAAFGFDRAGRAFALSNAACGFSYRHSALPEDAIVTHCILRGREGADPAELRAEMAQLRARREASQPIRERTGGSTFANPDPPGSPGARRAWELIDQAGQRGRILGEAQVSEKHCNFLINRGAASAAEIEALGEAVRAAVQAQSGVDLRWEIKRIGRPAAGD